MVDVKSSGGKGLKISETFIPSPIQIPVTYASSNIVGPTYHWSWLHFESDVRFMLQL